MSEINFGLLQPVDTGALTQQGFATGMAMVKHAQTQNALKGYLANPDDPQAYNALAAYDPGAAATIQQQQMIRRKMQLADEERQRQTEIGTLATTDPAAARTAALQGGDFDLAEHLGKIGDDERARTIAGFKAAAPIAYKLRQIQDPAQRKALFDQARPQLEAAGFSPEKLDQFDVTNDTALDAIITQGQTVDQLIDQGKVVWHQQGDQPSFATDAMGRPVGSQNPYAGGGVTTPASTSPGSGGSGSSRGLRNNNPLNLTESEFTRAQPGFAGTDSGGRYAKFDSPEAGMAAGQHLLGSYLQRGFDTPAEIIERWAPAKENGSATANYVGYVSRKLGIGPHDQVRPDQVPALMQAMSEFENGGRSGGQKRAMSVGAAPHVMTKAEFDKLPSGTSFVAPDGSHRVKP